MLRRGKAGSQPAIRHSILSPNSCASPRCIWPVRSLLKDLLVPPPAGLGRSSILPEHLLLLHPPPVPCAPCLHPPPVPCALCPVPAPTPPLPCAPCLHQSPVLCPACLQRGGCWGTRLCVPPLLSGTRRPPGTGQRCLLGRWRRWSACCRWVKDPARPLASLLVPAMGAGEPGGPALPPLP